jgi:O-antigen/teichoic acid export membrane protein/O-antigen ligase
MTFVTPKEGMLRSLASHFGIHPWIWVATWSLLLVTLGVGLFILPEFFPQLLIGILVGAGIILTLLSRIEFSILVIIFLVSSFIPPDIIDIRLPFGGGLELRDLAILGVLGYLAIQSLVRRRASIPWWPVSGPLLAFLILGVFSAIYAVLLENVALNLVFGELRILLYYATFFIAAWTIRTRKQLQTIIIGLFIIADLTASVVIIQQFFGKDNLLLTGMAGTSWQIWQEGDFSSGLGSVRIIPAGHVLMYFMMVIAFCLLIAAWKKPRYRNFALLQFLFLNFGLLFTFTRAQWLASAAAIFFALLLLLPKYRGFFIRLSLIFLVLFIILFGLLGSDLKGLFADIPFVNAVVERTASIFDIGTTMESYSMQWRVFETEEALRSIGENPLWGVGLGNAYRDLTTVQGENLGWITQDQGITDVYRFTRYVHNSFLMLAVKMGIPGLLLFLWFCGAFLFGSWKVYKRISNRVDKSVVLAIGAAFIGLMFWSIFHSQLIEAESTATIGLMVGLVACIHYVNNPAYMSSHTTLHSIPVFYLGQEMSSFGEAFRPVNPLPSIPKGIRSRFSKNLLFTIAGGGTSIFLLFLETLIAARILDPTNYGIYILLLAVVNFFVMAIDFGFKTTVTQMIASSDREAQGELVSNTLLFRLLVAAAISGLLWLGKDLLAIVDPTKALVELAPFVPLMIVITSFEELILGMLQGFHAYRHMAISQILRSVLRLGLSVLFLVTFKLGLMSLIYSWLISFGISTVYQYIVLPVPKRFNFRGTLLGNVLKFGLPLQLNRFLWFASGRIHVILLGTLSGPVSVAFFSVAERIPVALQRLSESFITVYFPTITTLMAEEKRDEALSILNGSLRVLSFIGASIALLGVLFSEQIITLLFTEKYADSASTFGILSLAFHMGLLVNIMGYTLTAAGHPERSLGENFTRTVVAILGNLLMIPPFGFVGSAIVTFIAYHSSNPLSLWLLRRSDISVKTAPYLAQSILLLLSAAFYWWIRPEVILHKVGIIALFIVLNILLSTFSIEDLGLIIPKFKTEKTRASVV